VLALTTPDATLIAAGVAAVAGVVKIASDAVSARGVATGAAHRSILEPHLPGLATNIHAVVAGAVLCHKRAKDSKPPGEALRHAKAAADVLKASRLEVKYVLPGLQEPLRTITRVPDWISTFKGDASADPFIESVQRLSRTIDATIARSYQRGRPPTRWEQWRLGRQAAGTRDAWEARFGRDALPDE
jgi:hypothetical protein